MPIDPNTLFYYLSFDEMPIRDSEGEVSYEKSKMWNTGWASVLFAVKDHCEEQRVFSREVCFLYKNNQRIKKKGYCIRDTINTISDFCMRMEGALSILCAALATLVLVLVCATYIVFPELDTELGALITLFSSIITFVTCQLVIAVARGRNAYRTDLISYKTYSVGQSKEQNKVAEKYQRFPETVVFRNVELVDGNIAEKRRNVKFSIKFDSNAGDISVSRNCKVFSKINCDDEACWILNVVEDPRSVIEHFNWRIVTNRQCRNSVRIVIVGIVDRKNIVFRNEMGKLCSYLDYEIPYRRFAEEDRIETLIYDRAYEQIGTNLSRDVKINFRFILEFKKQKVIIGFADICEQEDNLKMYPLSSSITTSTFSDNMFDDVTRIASEYAIAEYIGYSMSDR